MRTNIVIDDDLMTKAMEISQLKTKKETVELALHEFVSARLRLDISDLRGKIMFADGYDYKKARGDSVDIG
ncbi:MAG: type II toxin-antitoxin system VapB family antitoxin [Oscillospiraceae bacterium]|nr:type II toxin-antitoxin system VapB family antitoxin [Oscillospiraceae bacterium]MCL2279995.1 type II toxin-antitoxin system VapB family antitoxin [Oscillospiraceae bacterium]